MLLKIIQQLMKGQEDNPCQIAHLKKSWQINLLAFFINKIKKIRSKFQYSYLYTPPSRNCANLTDFRPISQEETIEILNSMKKTMCDIDPCSIHFFMEFKEVMLTTWTKIINTTLLNASFLQPWKKLLSDLIKPSKLDREFKNYQPISNLSLISM